ncbi:MAG: sporulation protein, partial [Hungatella sp.]
LIGVVIGFHMIQGLILPYVDALKNTTVQKLMGVIPGIGQGAAAITQIVLGSGVLVKNTIGMAAVLILLILAAIPILKLLILVLLYQMAAAMLEPICDKRLVSCMSAVSKGHKLLLELVMAAVLLFIITVALVCAGTNIVH